MIMHDGGNYFPDLKLLPDDWKAGLHHLPRYRRVPKLRRGWKTRQQCEACKGRGRIFEQQRAKIKLGLLVDELNKYDAGQ